MENIKKGNYLLISVIVIGILVIIGLVIQLCNFGRTVLVSNALNQGILVSGEGSISVKPDIARVSLGVEAEAPNAQAAQQKNADSMAKVVSVLKSLGLAEKDIQTTDFNLFPNRQYDKVSGREQVFGYRATNQVTITVRDLQKLGVAIDQSIQAGATNVNSVAFSVESPEQWRSRAITKAIDDARSKAEAMAKAAGTKIKRISYITESTIDVRPYLMNSFQKERVLGANTADKGTPMEPGNVKLTANVQLNFEI